MAEAVRGGAGTLGVALALVAAFAAPGAAEPRFALSGSAGAMGGSHVDIGPAFSVRALASPTPAFSVGIEAGTGVQQSRGVAYVTLPSQGPTPRFTEQLQFLGAVVVAKHLQFRGIAGFGAYDHVLRASVFVPSSTHVTHHVTSGISGGLGFHGEGVVAPLLEYRVHLYGLGGSTGGGRGGSSFESLWMGTAGLSVRF